MVGWIDRLDADNVALRASYRVRDEPYRLSLEEVLGRGKNDGMVFSVG